MNSYTVNKQEEKKDRLKSAVITAIIWSAILLFVFLYTVKITIPKEKEIVSTMLINFGDNRNGNGEEEPAEQEGSLAAKASIEPEESISKSEPEPAVEISKPEPKEKPVEKIITGTSTKSSVKTAEKKEKTEKSTPKKAISTPAKTTGTKSSTSKAETSNSTKGTGDGKGNAALGNLIKGRGTKNGSQGDGTGTGNAGDPLGGDGNGDSKIGVDRKLIGFIPGTMGRGGAQPTHNCNASGSITISYTVDKSGNVTSARRSGGNSDQCVVSTSTAWVKQYVKAERASVSSTGTYKITF